MRWKPTGDERSEGVWRLVSGSALVASSWRNGDCPPEIAELESGAGAGNKFARATI